MGQIFRTGAFLQQCWSVHPLCLSVRRFTADNQLGLACTSCRFAHYVTMASASVGAASGSEESPDRQKASDAERDARPLLASCLDAHAAALSLREMDVFEDVVVIRCAECRRHYALDVSAFETHQK